MNDLLNRLNQPYSTALVPTGFPAKRPRLIYAVNHSYPFSSNGYAVRTHGVATALVRSGVDVITASRPSTTWDQRGCVDKHLEIEKRIDGVRYLHLPKLGKVGLTLENYLESSVEAFAEMLRVFKPHAVMAASNWQNALPAAVAAREAGVPFFYEVRGFWEITQASHDLSWEHSPGFRNAVEGEVAVAKDAQRIFTINRYMRAELARRGIAEDKVDLVPNSFVVSPQPMENGSMSRECLGINARYVVGYIGSFNVYEGLEDLIVAVARLRMRRVDVALLLLGSGEGNGLDAGSSNACEKTVAYRQLSEQFKVGQFLFMPGRIRPEQIGEYYALLDLVVIPRRPFAVCELVSPIKPLEAIAHGKRVLLSDVAPLKDMANICSNISYFSKGNVDSLTKQLKKLLESGDFTPPPSKALETMTWETHVGPIAAAVRQCAERNGKLAKL
jgi:glycosyltransferase involved in cell wall biosynthesis